MTTETTHATAVALGYGAGVAPYPFNAAFGGLLVSTVCIVFALSRFDEPPH